MEDTQSRLLHWNWQCGSTSAVTILDEIAEVNGDFEGIMIEYNKSDKRKRTIITLFDALESHDIMNVRIDC